ncbi:hypothetical protein BDZ97DRAFT_766914 [Flammula alnicola]|nr:hypothetical protein BDZ97DRAFT_766914 [Flammula alnicola]
MFSRAHPPLNLEPSPGPTRLTKYLRQDDVCRERLRHAGDSRCLCHVMSKNHDPCDRGEVAHARDTEEFISLRGLINKEVDLSRTFACYDLFPSILNARPDIFVYDLCQQDEFVIITNSGLWDFVSYLAALDIAHNAAKSDRPGAILAAQSLGISISYGADGSEMVMVVSVADLFKSSS